MEDETRRDNKSSMTVSRLSAHWVSDDTEAYTINIYPGSGNRLRLTRIYSTQWLCNYNMLYYPFDTQVSLQPLQLVLTTLQTCPIILQPTGNSKTFIKLTEGAHKYSGPTELTQYFVRWVVRFWNIHYKESLRSSSFNSGNNTVQVSVILGRRLLGNFMTIYMPTILLNIIGHSTNYFKPFFFEAVVTVNLTVY